MAQAPKASKPQTKKKAPAKGRDLSAVEAGLNEERDELLRQIAEIEARHSGEGTDVNAPAEGEPEAAAIDQERDLSLLENARALLDQVDLALRRVADGTYGKCATCGKNIEAARLKALPHASLCISCKRLEERR